MKIKLRKTLLIFAIFAAFIVTPVPGINGHSDSNSDLPTVATNYGAVGYPEPYDGVNATAEVNRTVIVRANALIVLQDDITINLKDNVTKIYMVNYTLPTVFHQYVESAEIWVQYNNFVDIQLPENIRDADVFIGHEATSYFIDVTNDTKPIDTNVSKTIKIRTILKAYGAIEYSLYEFEQQGKFVTPVTTLLTSIPSVTTASIALEAKDDKFQTLSTGNYDLQNNSLEFKRKESNGYDPDVGLVEDVDYATIYFKSTTGEGPYTTTSELQFNDMKRTVTIDPMGWIYVKEEISVTHMGAPKPEDSPSYTRSYGVLGVKVSVPRTAVITDVYDSMGSLNHKNRDTSTGYPKTQLSADKGYRAVNVQFRNVIFGGDTYKFTVTYRFNSENVLYEDGNNFRFNATLFSRYNATVTNMQVVFKLPATATFVEHSYKRNTNIAKFDFQLRSRRDPFSLFAHQELVVNAKDLTEFDNTGFTITFKMNKWVAIFSPVMFYFVAFMLILGLYAAFAYKFAGKTSYEATFAKEKVPVKELEDFYKTFSEYQGAAETLEKLREDRRRKKLNKREYEEKSKTVNKRLKALNSELEKVVRAAKGIPHKYYSLIEDTMLTFNKLQNTYKNLRDNRRRYRSNEITKDVYLTQNERYTEEIAKMQNKIDRNMISIEELIH